MIEIGAGGRGADRRAGPPRGQGRLRRDRRTAAPVLAETLAGFQNVEIVNADVMKVDLRALIAEKLGGLRVVVCANLPYYITSPIVMGLLEQRLPIESVTVMVQKEAAQRLCALPARGRRARCPAPCVTTASRRCSFPFRAGRFCPRPTWIPPSSVWTSAGSRRRPGGRKNLLPGGARRLFDAAQDAAQLPFGGPAASQGARRGPARAGGGARGGTRRAAHAGTVRRRQPRAGGGAVIKNGAAGGAVFDCLVGHAVFDDMGGQPVNAAACSEVQPLRRHSSTVSPSSSRYPAKRSASRS